MQAGQRQMVLGAKRNECLLTRENNALAFQSGLTAAKFDKASIMQHIDRELSLAHSFFSSTGIYPAHLK
jgi:hypothetical protein